MEINDLVFLNTPILPGSSAYKKIRDQAKSTYPLLSDEDRAKLFNYNFLHNITVQDNKGEWLGSILYFYCKDFEWENIKSENDLLKHATSNKNTNLMHVWLLCSEKSAIESQKALILKLYNTEKSAEISFLVDTKEKSSALLESFPKLQGQFLKQKVILDVNNLERPLYVIDRATVWSRVGIV